MSSPAISLSRARTATAFSMSTSVDEREVGDRRLRLRHPPRDDLLRARQLDDRDVALRRPGLGDLRLGRPGRGGARRGGGLGLLLLARLLLLRSLLLRRGSPSPDAAFSTSALTIRPPGPLPSIEARSTPCSLASRRATGEALTRSPPLSSLERAAALRPRARPPARRPPRPRAPRRASPPARVLLRLGLVLLLLVGLPSASSSSVLLLAAVAARVRRRVLADGRDDLADRQRVALAGDGVEDALLVGLVGHRRLVRLDLGDLLALGHLVARRRRATSGSCPPPSSRTGGAS